MPQPRDYYVVPEVPNVRAVLNPQRGFFSVVIPLARTNLITNPSLETNTTNYTAVGGSMTRSAQYQYHGVYSLAMTPSAGTNSDGAYFGPVALTSGVTYAYSCKFKGTAGRQYKISIATTGGADLTARVFTATGRWQWVWGFWTETSSTSRRFYIRKNNHGDAAVFFADGLQIESCADGILAPTTYIDGDQAGLLPRQYPAPYRWNGTPHASTSTRDVTTRAGGYVLNLDRFRFQVLAYVGLGLAVVANVATTGAGSDGAQYENTAVQSRQFAIQGVFEATTPAQLDRERSNLYAAVGPHAVTPRQPLTLLYQAFDGRQERSSMGRIVASYESGLEQNATVIPREESVVTFTQWLPAIFGGDAGAVLDVQDSITNANAIVKRSASGEWSALGTGLSGAGVTALAIAPHPDGTVYVGGVFTDAGGSGADYAAIYTPATDTWSVIKAATTFNAQVNAIAIAPNGDVIFGGLFTNADGIANADGIVRYTPATNTFAALGTGVNAGGVYSLAFDQAGNLYAGGSFTLMGGVASTVRIAKWDGSAWSALGTGASSAIVRALLVVGTNLYAGGDFALMGGVANTVNIARWDGSVWNAMGTGTGGGAVTALIQLPDGMIYIGGLFATIDGLAVPFLARWNGTGYSAVGAALSSYVQAFAKLPTGALYLGGDFAEVGGVTYPDRVALWGGGSFAPIDIDLPGSATIFSLAVVPGTGELYVGYNTTGTATGAGITTVTNTGTADAYPVITIKGPTTGTSRLYQIANVTTGGTILLNLIINAGETITVRTSQSGVTLFSDFMGDVSGALLTSTAPFFALRPGANTISFFAAGATVTATMRWAIPYQSAADLVE